VPATDLPDTCADSDAQGDAETVEDTDADDLPHVLADPVAQFRADDVDVADTFTFTDTDAVPDTCAGRVDESRSRDPRTLRIGRDADGIVLDLAPLPELAVRG
jgi:hypothetical protein